MRPMRLAGTARQYSKKAMPQLISTISHIARCSTLSWPYQAKVMNTLEATSSRTGATAVQLIGIQGLRQVWRSGRHPSPYKPAPVERQCEQGPWREVLGLLAAPAADALGDSLAGPAALGAQDRAERPKAQDQHHPGRRLRHCRGERRVAARSLRTRIGHEARRIAARGPVAVQVARLAAAVVTAAGPRRAGAGGNARAGRPAV